MILITGSSGFLGSNLTQWFGDNAIGLTRREPIESKRQLQADLLADNCVEQITSQLGSRNITCIVHAAAVTPWSETPYFEEDLVMVKNVDRLANVLGVKKLIYTSGWNVYSTDQPTPYNEETITKPDSIYGKSKLAVEEYIKSELNMPDRFILRIASVYGPGQTSPGLISNITKQAMGDGKVVLKSRKTARDYVYLDDVLESIDTLIRGELSGYLTLNIGSGVLSSVETVAQEIVQAIKKLCAQKAEIIYEEPLQEAALQSNLLDIQRARFLGMLQKTTPLSIGIRNYIQWIIDETVF